MEELLNYLENGETLVFVTISAVVITLVTHLIFKKYRFVKYIPGLIYMALGLFNLLIVLDDLTSSNSMDKILLFLILFTSGAIGIFFALIIGIYNKPRKVKKVRVKPKE